MPLKPALLMLLGFALIPNTSCQESPTVQATTPQETLGEKKLVDDWSAGKLPVLWTHPIGEGYCLGAVANGRFFQFDREQDRARLTCRDVQTGEQLWQTDYPTSYEDLYGYDGGPRSTPVIDDDRVYTFGVEGLLHCRDVKDGALLWSIDTAKVFGVVQNFFGVGSTPLVYNDQLIVMVGGSPEASQQAPPGALDQVESNGTAIVAFDKFTGKVLYQTGDDLASYSSPVIRTIAGRDWCFAFCRNQLLGFDPHNGQLEFQFPWRARKLESVNACTPLVTENRIFITEAYGPGAAMLELNEKDPQVVWKDQGRDKSIAAHWATPIEIDGYLYGCHGQHQGTAELRCIDAVTGEVKWSEPNLDRTSLTYVDGHFVCLSETGRLLLLKVNPNQFELVTELEPSPDQIRAGVRLTYPCWQAPLIAGELLYVRGKNRLICFQLLDTGQGE